MPGTTQIWSVRSALVAVSDLDRSIGFYKDVAKLRQLVREDQLALLGDERHPPFSLYLREGKGSGRRYGQEALGLRSLCFDAPSVAELDRIEGQLRHLSLLRDRHRLDDEGFECVRGYDPDRLPLVFVATGPEKDLSVGAFHQIAALLYGVDV